MSRQSAPKSNPGKELRDRADARAGKPVAYTGKSEFVNYSLTMEETQHVKKTEITVEFFESTVIRLTEEGYAVSFSYDDYNSCYSCLLRPKFTNNPNAGFLLNGRGSTPVRALRQAAYIHYIVFESDWSAHYQQSKRQELDD